MKENQTDKNKTEVFLYVDDPVEKHTFLEAAKGKGYDVLVMDGRLDSHYINWYESKNKESRFVRVDSDVVDVRSRRRRMSRCRSPRASRRC